MRTRYTSYTAAAVRSRRPAARHRRAISALLLPGNCWISGQRIEISGGMFL
ncbi:MAG TPA: hypothetical protein VGI11_10835 [Variovorax sp.]